MEEAYTSRRPSGKVKRAGDDHDVAEAWWRDWFKDVIPAEVLDAVLLEVDTVSLVCCQFVCRRWRATVASLHSSTATTVEYSARHQRNNDSVAYLRQAVRLGYLAVVQWARGQGCAWDATVCAAAARGGDLILLQWLHDNGCEWDKAVCIEAAAGGHLETLQWAHDEGCAWDETVCAAAARAGHMEMVQWLHSNGCPWDQRTCAEAAGAGHLEILVYARTQGCAWDVQTPARAAAGGHLDILKWARKRRCPWDSSVFAIAAEAGDLDILLWLRAKACPWDGQVSLAAARSGRLDILQWLHANYRFAERRQGRSVLEEAAGGGHLEVVEWACSVGCEWTEDVPRAAAMGGHIPVLQWALDHGWDIALGSGVVITGAAEAGQLDTPLGLGQGRHMEREHHDHSRDGRSP